MTQEDIQAALKAVQEENRKLGMMSFKELEAAMKLPISEIRELFRGLLRQIASRGYPAVWVEEAGTTATELLDLQARNEDLRDAAKRLGVQRLNGLDVVEHGLIEELEGYTNQDSGPAKLFFDVLHVLAAKMHMIVLDAPDKHRDIEGKMSSLKSSTLVPVEELVLVDVDEALIAWHESYAKRPYQRYIIRRTPRVEALLAEYGEYYDG